jgi:LuxR family maltose regulon positive regulatory protein
MKLGKNEKAIAKLIDSFTLAEPRGFVRTYLDMGEDMAELLTKFPRQHPYGEYAEMLRAAFPNGDQPFVKSKHAGNSFPHSQHKETLQTPFTNREHEIVLLLHKRLSNQEIADNLFISYGTVKRHTANIYKKLQVRNRHEAVSKALSLGIISEPGHFTS